MQRAIAISPIAQAAARIDLADRLRSLIVVACAAALILAGPSPF